MTEITFNAFSSLQKKLKKQQIDCVNAPIKVAPGFSALDLIFHMGLGKDEVEAVLINGRISAFYTILKEGDRVGFLPRMTTGAGSHLSGLKHLGL